MTEKRIRTVRGANTDDRKANTNTDNRKANTRGQIRITEKRIRIRITEKRIRIRITEKRIRTVRGQIRITEKRIRIRITEKRIRTVRGQIRITEKRAIRRFFKQFSSRSGDLKKKFLQKHCLHKSRLRYTLSENLICHTPPTSRENFYFLFRALFVTLLKKYFFASHVMYDMRTKKKKFLCHFRRFFFCVRSYHTTELEKKFSDTVIRLDQSKSFAFPSRWMHRFN